MKKKVKYSLKFEILLLKYVLEKKLEKETENIKFSSLQEAKKIIDETREKISILQCLINDNQSEVNYTLIAKFGFNLKN